MEIVFLMFMGLYLTGLWLWLWVIEYFDLINYIKSVLDILTA